MIHTVKKGDTLTGIARTYNTTIAAIVAANAFIIHPDKIKVGWKITIPEKTAETPKPPAKDNSELSEKLNRCLSDIENLESFKELVKLI